MSEDGVEIKGNSIPEHSRIPLKPFARRQKVKRMGKLLTEARDMTMKDHLTELPNTKWFEEDLVRRFADARRQGRGLWVLYADIDLFKGINDKHGHPVGDEILRAFGAIGSREEEPIARIGGEEFAQVIKDGLDLESVKKIVSRYSLNFKEKSKEILGYKATLSFGIARMQEGDTPQTLRERADAALYHSKRNGRDKATLLEGPVENGNFRTIPFLPREALTPPQPVPTY